ncbi:MAG: hypothetical protein GX213_02435 [Clostridiaceae bacterium]|nr:hypothetical protein [Clostridiaceae bacterium]
MNEKVKKALKLFESGFNCAQSVVGIFYEDFDIGGQFMMRIEICLKPLKLRLYFYRKWVSEDLSA